MATIVLRSSVGRVLRAGAKTYTGADPLEFRGVSNTFPFTLSNTPGGAPPNGALLLVFSAPTSVKIDYGDGTVRYLQTYTSPYANSLIITANTGQTAPYTDAIYYYPDGQNIERTVKVSYDRGSLLEYRQTSAWGMPQQSLNFAWYAHPRLQAFVSSAAYVTNINIAGLTSTTNPFLKNLAVTFFGTTSPYYAKVPETILNIPLEILTLGGIGYNNTTLTMEQMNVHKIATSVAGGTLKNLIFQNITPWTDAQGLPSNFVLMTKLESLTFNNCRYTVFPQVVNQLTWLKSLTVANLNGYMLGWGGIDNLVNIESLSFVYATHAASFGLFPTAWNNFAKLRAVIFSNSGTHISANTTAYVNMIFDLITRTNTPKTGSNSGSIPFRGMTFSVSANGLTTAVDGAIEAPPGYIAGSDNGTPTTTGHKIFLLRNQYGTTVSLST